MFGNARFLRSILDELLFGNDGVCIYTRAQNDISSDVGHVNSANSVARAERLYSSPESNRGVLYLNKWIGL